KTYYRILDGKLAFTPDSTGTMVEGEMAENYILTKK
ncbi:MAG: copper resistance protein NlpE, partial [Bacteroidales bacterium]|nr:copper resistance protein NlpE [Bacteroidales bacterium]